MSGWIGTDSVHECTIECDHRCDHNYYDRPARVAPAPQMNVGIAQLMPRTTLAKQEYLEKQEKQEKQRTELVKRKVAAKIKYEKFYDFAEIIKTCFYSSATQVSDVFGQMILSDIMDEQEYNSFSKNIFEQKYNDISLRQYIEQLDSSGTFYIDSLPQSCAVPIKLHKRDKFVKLPYGITFPMFTCTKCNRDTLTYYFDKVSGYCAHCAYGDRVARLTTKLIKQISCKKCNCIMPFLPIVNGSPTCFFCRNASEKYIIQCITCGLQFCSGIEMQQYVCYCCREGSMHDISVKDILKYVPYATDPRIYTNIQKIKASHDAIDHTQLYEYFRELYNKSNMQQMCTKASIIDCILYMKENGFYDNEQIECSICSTMYKKNAFVKVCNNACPPLCLKCLLSCITSVEVGHYVDKKSISCPFCMSYMKWTIVSEFLKTKSAIPIAQTIGLCGRCHSFREYPDRRCEVDTSINGPCPPCRVCIPPGTEVERVVNCQLCNSYMLKIILDDNGVRDTSCNHVRCPNNHHICAFKIASGSVCNKSFTDSSDCYNHMTAAHGSYYDLILRR